LSIALKETNETEYWLELLYQSNYLEQKLFDSLHRDCKELLKLLISVIKTSKQNNGK
jgi:four helix bundle protein